MASQQQVSGIVFVKIDGAVQRSKPGAKLMMGGVERTAIIANGKVVGFAEKGVAATVSFTLAHKGGDDLIALQDSIDSTLEFETDTGDTYVVSPAFASKPAELSDGEGDVAFEFQGPKARKL